MSQQQVPVSVSPLRRRMLDDMAMRGLREETQRTPTPARFSAPQGGSVQQSRNCAHSLVRATRLRARARTNSSLSIMASHSLNASRSWFPA